jgi:hypothetical protein
MAINTTNMGCAPFRFPQCHSALWLSVVTFIPWPSTKLSAGNLVGMQKMVKIWQ